MKKLLLITLLIVGCGFADTLLDQTEEVIVLEKGKSYVNNSENKWSINVGFSSTKGSILAITRNYRMNNNASVYVLGGLLNTGLGVIYEDNYNDNGYVYGGYSGFDLSAAGYNSILGWDISISWRISPYIAYQWVLKKQHCFSVGISPWILKPVYWSLDGKPLPYGDKENYKIDDSFKVNVIPVISYEYKF